MKLPTQFYLSGALALTAATTGCISVKTHSSIEPIQITLDVNLKVQLEEELQSVFGEIDAASTTVTESETPPSNP
ncbi:MAG: hypothetical protein AAF212_10755 [Verrucomicrobiota bacterium]